MDRPVEIDIGSIDSMVLKDLRERVKSRLDSLRAVLGEDECGSEIPELEITLALLDGGGVARDDTFRHVVSFLLEYCVDIVYNRRQKKTILGAMADPSFQQAWKETMVRTGLVKQLPPVVLVEMVRLDNYLFEYEGAYYTDGFVYTFPEFDLGAI